MATLIVDWLKLRDLTKYVFDEKIANEIISCIRSGRTFNKEKFPGLNSEDSVAIHGIIMGARAAIQSTRAGT